jgi:putative phosphoesterase
MVRIGLISDTHGLLRPEARAFLRGSDRIVHAGDICDPRIIQDLQAIAPLTAVRGNCDQGPWAGRLRASESLRAGGVLLHVIHDLAQLDVDPAKAGVRVVVSGHSHRPRALERDGVLYVNPGSAGPRRFQLPVAVGELVVDGAAVSARLHRLDLERAAWEPLEGPPGLVIFDLDDVLASLDRGRRLRWLAGATGKPPDHFDAAIYRSDFEPAAEAGAYPTGAQYLAEFNLRTGCRLNREQWVEARRQAMTVLPGTLAVARDLARVTRIAMLTNNGALLKESLPELVPEVWAVFGDACHASFEFRARKPDPKVYLGLLARYGVAPGQALMIDDSPSNVQGARDAGLQALRFRDPDQLREDLRGLWSPPLF